MSEPDLMQFIFATEETGFRHLYLYTVQLATSTNKATTDGSLVSRAVQIDKQQLTSGDWEVLDQWLWVDHKNGLIYFMGLCDSPLSSHLYVTSYVRPGSNIVRLTQSGYSHSVSMDKVRLLIDSFPLIISQLIQLEWTLGVHHVCDGVQQHSVHAGLPDSGVGTGYGFRPAGAVGFLGRACKWVAFFLKILYTI